MPPKILVVDDIDSNLLLVERSLGGLDAEIETTRRPLEALAMAGKTEYALFILDVQMPQMMGFELADEIRKTKFHSVTPIVFVTGIYSDIESIYKGYQSGGLDYITKPFNRKILYSKVKSFLDLYNSRKELADKTRILEVNNEELKEANLRERRNKEKFRLLSKMASEFQEIEAGVNIYKKLGSKLSEVYPESMSILSSYDAETNSLQVEHIVDTENKLETVNRILGGRVQDLHLKLDQEIFQTTLKSRLIPIPDLYQLTLGSIPKTTCKDISDSLQINKIYSSGFTWNERLYGTISLLFFGNDKIVDPDFTEAFIRQASMTIQRWMKDRSLRASEARYRNLFETMAQGVVYENAEGEIVDANPAAKKILGTNSRIFIGSHSDGKRMQSLDENGKKLPVEKHPSFVALNTGKEVQDFVMGVFNQQTNSYKWILVDAIPQFKPGEKKAYQVYTIFEDITERREYEIKLRFSEEKFQKSFNNSPDAILISDFETGKIWDVNKGTSDMFGLRKEQLLNKSFINAGILKSPSVVKYIHDRLAQNQKVINYEVLLESLSGESIYGLISADLLYLSERKFVLNIIRDITDLKKTEERLIGSVVEGADQERRRISEELHDSLGQTLTAAILSFEKFKAKPDVENIKVLDTGLGFLHRAIQDSRDIINDLMPRSIEDFGLIAAIQSLLKHLQNSAGINFQFYHTLNDVKLTSPIEHNIYRITQEISHNIIRHSGAKAATLQIIFDDDKLIYTFEDDGNGMKKPDFIDEHEGMGFKNMRNRIRSLGGSFEVESEEGKGTLIYLEIPYKDEPAK